MNPCARLFPYEEVKLLHIILYFVVDSLCIQSILSEMGATSKVYLNKAVTSLGNSSDLILMFDDENAYEYLSENRAGCMDTLASLIEKRIGKKVEVTVKKNNSAVSAKEAVVDLTDMINFDIEEEN